MTHYTDLEYLKLSLFRKMTYRTKVFLSAIPHWFANIFIGLWKAMKKFGAKVRDEAVDIWTTFRYGDWKTRISYLIMGFGSLARGQWVRGLLFLLMEIAFIFYMVVAGAYYLSMFTSLGLHERETKVDEEGWEYIVEGDNSFKILLYILITLLFIVAFIWTWRLNVKQNRIAQDIIREGKQLRSGKEDLQSLLDDQFHKTMLALPLLGILVFTVLPIIFMILVAFTNYGKDHDPATGKLFTWIGWDNFDLLFGMKSTGTSEFGVAFGEIIVWTLI